MIRRRCTGPAAVRSAFNSPFWPFVLASTSVGQEGLDFHQYCHAIVHWNLPANPVDLEQREGRVHRYKGHAIRKNVADKHRCRGVRPTVVDPWEAMFGGRPQCPAARAPRHGAVLGLRGFRPIERHIPFLPSAAKLSNLLAYAIPGAYRLVFGQPRQEDLVEYLRERMSPETLESLVQQLRINLTPR